ncbi:MAG: NAD(P)-dependent oxidoreductase [Clostridiales bacterium]|jgi:nucleoside-diphosphate-sugar epimerase|nr:NAD(P)-dependent oxidoreductase [Clostridiales bacterium]
MKILVTGGAGFIGRAFVSKYKRAHEIVAPKHAELDCTKMAQVIQFIKGADAVVHFAQAQGDPVRSRQDNIQMYQNLKSACVMYKVKKLIVIGSGFEYNLDQEIKNVTEADVDKSRPNTLYGDSKYMITHLARLSDVDTYVLRFFDVYGPKSRPNFLMDTIGQAAHGQDLLLPKNRVFSAIFVLDAVRITEKFLTESYPAGEYNVIPPHRYEYKKVLGILYNVSEKTINVKVEKPKEFEPEYTGNSDKLLALLDGSGYRWVSPRAGIKKTYNRERTRALKEFDRARAKEVKKEIRKEKAREKRRLNKLLKTALKEQAATAE